MMKRANSTESVSSVEVLETQDTYLVSQKRMKNQSLEVIVPENLLYSIDEVDSFRMKNISHYLHFMDYLEKHSTVVTLMHKMREIGNVLLQGFEKIQIAWQNSFSIVYKTIKDV